MKQNKPFPLYPLDTCKKHNYRSSVIETNTITLSHFSPRNLVSMSKVSKVCNINSNKYNSFGLDKERFIKIMSLIAGRIDFYWKYINNVPYMQKEEASLDFLMKHFAGIEVGGFSPFIDNKTIMFAGVDFDAHTSDELTAEENQELIRQAQQESESVYQFLKSKGYAVIKNSSGSKGRHVRLLCPGAKAKDMRIYLKWVLEKVLGDCDKHEIFPKQDDLNDERKYGNQMKGCLGIHQKYRKRSNVMIGEKVLDFLDSVKYICAIVDELENFKSIEMPEEEYKRIEAQDTQVISRIKNLNVNKLNFTNEGSVPSYCAVMEEIASDYCLPSSGKHTRHHCLDPNVASYGIKHPTIREKYQQVQGRASNTAFDNWSKYWGDEPVFKCSQVIGYLKNWANKNNLHCQEGLKLCFKCPRFKKFLEQKNTPKGKARTLIISEIAKNECAEKCPKCKSKFFFDDNRGLFYCKKCKVGGGLNLFGKLCVLNKSKQEQTTQ